MLRTEALSYGVGKKTLLQATTLSFEAGKFHVVMGPNGAGKSTLLQLLAGALTPSSGSVYLEDEDLKQYSKKTLAKRRAVLSQQTHITFPITVQDVVLMGRYPYFSTVASRQDLAICRRAMEQMQVDGFADRDYQTLSGGEAQKVQMSRVLAQMEGGDVAKILFLDEPVSHLDIRYQQQLLQTARELCAKNITVIAVLHDLNLALRYADRMLLMKEGRILHDMDEVGKLTEQMITEVFDVPARIYQPPGHHPVVLLMEPARTLPDEAK